MTIDHESIIEKKAKLNEAISVLKDLRSHSFEDVRDNQILTGAILHYLMLSIEIILDIGSHILAEDFDETPDTYKKIILLLGDRAIIPADLTQRSTGMASFRNKMIHEYMDVDAKKVYAYLQKAPDEFEQFAEAFSEYLQKSTQ